MGKARGIRAGRAYVELGTDDRYIAGLRRAQRRLQAFGASVTRIGQQMLKVAAIGALPFAISGKVFATFEQRMARVQALTGATGDAFNRLEAEAKRLGETTVFSASQAAEALSFFALAGFSVDQMLKAIGPTLNLAAAGQLDIAQAADIAAKIMAGMGIEADDLAGAVDILTKAMTTANTNLEQLGDAMKFVGPIAKAAGVEFEELVAAIQLLSNAGIQADMAGTSLRMMILSLTSPSMEAAKQLDNLGVRVADAEGNVRPLADIIGDLERALRDMGSAARLDILGRIFPARSAGGVAVLLEQGSDRLREFTAALRDAGGTAERIATTQLNTLQGTMTILKSAAEGLGIAIGDAISGPLRVITRGVTQAVGALTTWVKANRQTVVAIAGIVLGIGALGAGLIAVGLAAKIAAFALGTIAGVFVAAKVAAGALLGLLGALVTPIGLVIVAIAGLGTAAAVYSGAASKAIEWLRGRFNALRAGVGEVLSAIAEALKSGDIELAANILWAGLHVAWAEGVALLVKTWVQMKSPMVTAWRETWFAIITTAEEGITQIQTGFERITAFYKKGWEEAKAMTKDLIVRGQYKVELLDISAAEKLGDISAEQAAKLRAEAESRMYDKLRDIMADENSQINDIITTRNDLLEELEREHAATILSLENEFMDAQKALLEGGNAEIAEATKKLEDAKIALQNFIRPKVGATDFGGKFTIDPNLNNKVKDAMVGMADAIARSESKGTFLATNTLGLQAGGGSIQEHMADDLSAIRKNTQKLRDVDELAFT